MSPYRMNSYTPPPEVKARWWMRLVCWVKARWWMRLVCWNRGHDYEITRSAKPPLSVPYFYDDYDGPGFQPADFYSLIGADAVCLRCGKEWLHFDEFQRWQHKTRQREKFNEIVTANLRARDEASGFYPHGDV